MPKKKSDSRALVPSAPPNLYLIAETAITPLQLVRVKGRHPSGDGPWKQEVDKIAWVDRETELACTILRQEDGTLSGYVGLPAEHPLFGYAYDAIPSALGIVAHGGLDYAQACDEDGPEEIAVCHPSEGEHDLLWWFGFACDRSYDYVPSQSVRDGDLGAENGRTYKSEGYVYREVVKLARQLKAIGEGGNDSGLPLDLSASTPVGLDGEDR